MLILNSFRIMWCFFPDTILNTIPTLESCGGDCSHFVERFNRQSRLSNDWFLCVTIIIITIRTGRIEFWFKRLNYRQSRGLYAISTPPIAHKSMLGLTSQKSMFRQSAGCRHTGARASADRLAQFMVLCAWEEFCHSASQSIFYGRWVVQFHLPCSKS